MKANDYFEPPPSPSTAPNPEGFTGFAIDYYLDELQHTRGTAWTLQTITAQRDIRYTTIHGGTLRVLVIEAHRAIERHAHVSVTIYSGRRCDRAVVECLPGKVVNTLIAE